jgi:outer membrane protein assembly factor BamB
MQLVARLPGPVGPLTATDDAVYGLYRSGGPSEARRVVRFDLQTGRVVSSASLDVAPDIAVAGGLVWVTGHNRHSLGGGIVLGLDPRSLEIDRRIELWRPGHALAATSSGLWIGSIHRLRFLDPATTELVDSFNVPGEVARLAIAPTGRRIFVSANVPGHSGAYPLTELDAQTGQKLAVSPVAMDFRANWLSAMSEGVWVSAPTGDIGAAFFLRNRDLRSSGRWVEAGWQVAASLAAGRLWIQGAVGDLMVCAAKRTGRIKGSVRVPTPLKGGDDLLSNVVEAGGNLFVGAGRGLLRFSPLACR